MLMVGAPPNVGEIFGAVGPHQQPEAGFVGRFNEVGQFVNHDGVECQRAKSTDMVFSIPTILAYISQFITLEAGDIVRSLELQLINKHVNDA